MARVTDVQGYQRKYDNQMALLEDADIDDADRREIKRFVAHLRTNDSDVDSLGTVVGHLNRLRLSSERAQMPLTEFETIDDANGFELYLEDYHGLSGGTIRNYKKALRKFFIWLHGEDEFGDDIVIGSPIEREHDPAENITADELQALLDACLEYDNTARDRALIALLRDTGLRIGAVLSLQRKHLDFEDSRGTLTINEEANVKGASGTKPVTWSRAYVANWLDEHPRGDDPEAPVIHKTQDHDPDDPEDDGALTQQYAARRITKIAATAGLESDRIHAHLFRGTAISEWIIDDIQTPTIEHRVDWVEGSEQRKVYQRVEDGDFNNAIFDHYGVEGDEDAGDAPYKLKINSCPVCDTTLSGTEVHCPQCGAHVQAADSMSLDDVDESVQEFLVEEDDGDKRKVAAAMADQLGDDSELTRALLEELAANASGD